VRNPSLIIEVLSPSTEGDDRGRKFGLYSDIESVQEYVLVSSDTRIMVMKRETGPFWQIRKYKPEDEVVHLTELGISFTFAEVYEDTEWPDEEDLIE